VAQQPEAERTAPPPSLLERVRAQPERAAEHIALAAAERLAPQAARWAARGHGAGRGPHELAEETVRKHVRMAAAEGGALGIGGIVTVVPDLLALAWIQSRMVLYVAAAHGFDPTHPMRPAELLALQGFYETAAEAREALDGTGRPLAVAMVDARIRRGRERALVSRLLRYAGRRVATRAASRFVPLASAPIAAAGNAGATRDLGHRALRFYGG
jgi:hypothetical protein